MIEIVVVASASVTGLTLVYLLLSWQASFTKPSIDEVEAFLRAVPHPGLEELLYPENKEKRRPASYAIRREHRVMVELLRNYLLMMHGNATFLRNWGKTEWSDMLKHNCTYDDATIARIRELIDAAAVFWKAARRALFIIWIWRLSRFDEWSLFPLPNVARLRRIGGIDIIEAYARLRRAAVALAQEYGEPGKQIARYINMSMLGPNDVGA